MIYWKNVEIGQTLLFTLNNMGKHIEREVTVTEKHTNHALCVGANMTLKLDEDDQHLFYPIKKDSDGNVVHENIVKFPMAR